MADYSVTGNPISLSRGASSLIRVEFGLIQTAIATKVDNTGDTYTGTHDMTGATVTVAAPITATQAATKGYCDALAFATVLPDQTGNSGELVTTNGVTASWTPIKTVGGASIIGSGDIAILGSGGRAITGNLVLTVTSGVIADAAISVTPATPGLYVTMPDATTITSEGVTQISVYNAGDYDYGVKDSAGTQLGWVRPRTGAIIGLADNSTAAGVWAPYGLEKTGITASYVNSTVTNMGSTIRRIALDANRTCFLFGGVDCYAIVYDASTQTWGTATLVRASVGSGLFNGVLAATDKVLVFSCSSTTAIEAVTLSILTNTITVNTGTKATAVAGANMSAMGQIIAVGTSWVVAYLASSPCIQAMTVTGTTPTIGSSLSPSGTAVPILFASGSIVRTIGTSATNVYCFPFTVSGSGLSTGTAANVSASAAGVRAFLNGNGNIVCQYINTTHYATIFKLTGTTEAASSVSLGTAPANAIITADYLQVTSSKTVFAWHASSTSWYCNTLTDTAGTASAGTAINGLAVGNASELMGLTYIGNYARFAFKGGRINAQLTFDISGTSPSLYRVDSQYGYVSTEIQPYPRFFASNLFGDRNPGTLIAGSSVYVLGGKMKFASGAYLSDAMFTANSFRSVPTLQVAVDSASASRGITGGSSSISWIGGLYDTDGGSTGFVVQQVECAA